MAEADPFAIELKTAGPLFESRSFQALFDQEISADLAELGGMGQRMVVAGTPRGASQGAAGLRGSIFTELRGRPGMRSQVVASSVFYAPIVERGRRPGKMPPPKALLLWVVRKLGIADKKEARSVAFLVARKIGRIGTTGAAMFFNAAQRLEPIARERFRALGERLARHLGGS